MAITSWTDEGMTWAAPDLREAVYIEALQQAIRERLLATGLDWATDNAWKPVYHNLDYTPTRNIEILRDLYTETVRLIPYFAEITPSTTSIDINVWRSGKSPTSYSINWPSGTVQHPIYGGFPDEYLEVDINNKLLTFTIKKTGGGSLLSHVTYDGYYWAWSTMNAYLGVTEEYIAYGHPSSNLGLNFLTSLAAINDFAARMYDIIKLLLYIPKSHELITPGISGVNLFRANTTFYNWKSYFGGSFTPTEPNIFHYRNNWPAVEPGPTYPWSQYWSTAASGGASLTAGAIAAFQDAHTGSGIGGQWPGGAVNQRMNCRYTVSTAADIGTLGNIKHKLEFLFGMRGPFVQPPGHTIATGGSPSYVYLNEGWPQGWNSMMNQTFTVSDSDTFDVAPSTSALSRPAIYPPNNDESTFESWSVNNSRIETYNVTPQPFLGGSDFNFV